MLIASRAIKRYGFIGFRIGSSDSWMQVADTNPGPRIGQDRGLRP